MPILDIFRRRTKAQTPFPPLTSPLLYYADSAGVTAIKGVSGGADLAAQGSRELQHEVTQYGLAWLASVWAFRALTIRAGKVAEILAAATLVNRQTGQPAEYDPLAAAVRKAYATWQQNLFEAWALSLFIFGEAYLEDVQDWGAHTFRVLNASRMDKVKRGSEIVRYVYNSDDAGSVSFAREDIVYDRTYNPLSDGDGLSLIAVALDAINIDRQQQIAARNFMRNNMRPGIIFSARAPLSDTDLERVLTKLREEHSGSANSGRALFLNQPMDITTVSPPEFADQMELSTAQMERVAAACGVPLALMNYNSMRFQMSPEQRLSFYTETVLPDVRRMAQAINTFILPRIDGKMITELRIDEATVLGQLEPQESKAARVRADFQTGIRTFNEARLALGMEPVAGGDWFAMDANIVPVHSGQVGQTRQLLADARPAPLPAIPMPGLTAALPEPRAIQDDALDELRAWRKKAHNGGAGKAAGFVCYHLPESTQTFIRSGLKAATGKTDIDALFSGAERELKKKIASHSQVMLTLSWSGSVPSWAWHGSPRTWSLPTAPLLT